MALHLIILGVKTIITWSLGCGFKETSSWHSSGHSNHNSRWCFCGTLWMLFGPYLGYLNPNLGLLITHGSINPNYGYHSLHVHLTPMSYDSPSSIILGSYAWSSFIHNHLFMFIHVDSLVLVPFIVCLCPLVWA